MDIADELKPVQNFLEELLRCNPPQLNTAQTTHCEIALQNVKDIRHQVLKNDDLEGYAHGAYGGYR